jgi:hypothetical protein
MQGNQLILVYKEKHCRQATHLASKMPVWQKNINVCLADPVGQEGGQLPGGGPSWQGYLLQ